MQPLKPLKLRLIGPHHPASSVTLQLPAVYPSTTDPRIQCLFRHSNPLGQLPQPPLVLAEKSLRRSSASLTLA